IENRGSGQFSITPLPLQVQAAPVFGIASTDADGDGALDLLLVGNDYGMEPGSGRHDALNGLYLKGNGKGNFTPVPGAASGFFVPGDGKGLGVVYTAKKEVLYLATQNSDSLLVYHKTIAGGLKWLEVKKDDLYAELVYAANKKRRVEFYYGATFLSQSSRMLPVDKAVVKVIITGANGAKRNVPMN
ncbi:MAG TPA: hypothetical protein VM010_04925, partial [Chitinophagaceae bacterium]|nr:hypothetical protein [Chitinophagaceae bacterium]